MKAKKLDSKGNIIVGTTAILIVALLIISIFVITAMTFIKDSNIESEANDNFKYIIDDYSANLEVLGRDAIAEATQKVYNGLPVKDSEGQIKKNLNKILIAKNEEFKQKYDIDLSSDVISVEPTDSPWRVLFKVQLNGKKDNEEFSQIVERNASIEGLRDPLPIAKLTIASGVMSVTLLVSTAKPVLSSAMELAQITSACFLRSLARELSIRFSVSIEKPTRIWPSRLCSPSQPRIS